MAAYKGLTKQVVSSGNFCRCIVDSVCQCEKARDVFLCGNEKGTLEMIQCVYKAEYHFVFQEFCISCPQCVGDIYEHKDK
jgi:hypothetical protein